MCSRLGPSLGCWLASVLPVVQAPRPGEAPPRALKPAVLLASRGDASGVRTRWGGVFLDDVAGPLLLRPGAGRAARAKAPGLDPKSPVKPPETVWRLRGLVQPALKVWRLASKAVAPFIFSSTLRRSSATPWITLSRI